MTNRFLEILRGDPSNARTEAAERQQADRRQAFEGLREKARQHQQMREDSSAYRDHLTYLRNRLDLIRRTWTASLGDPTAIGILAGRQIELESQIKHLEGLLSFDLTMTYEDFCKHQPSTSAQTTPDTGVTPPTGSNGTR